MGPPSGLHKLLFKIPRAFNEQELYKLAPAADFYRTLIGVDVGQNKEPQIWGLIHSGTRWIQTFFGGRKISPSLPAGLAIYVAGPGQISVCLGSETIATLNGGKIYPPSPDVFAAQWLSESFTKVHHKMRALHETAREESKKSWAVIDREYGKNLAQQTVRRIIGIVRYSHHGGMLIYVPMDMGHDLSDENPLINIKYPFLDEEPRHRFATLMLRIMNRLAELYGDPDDPQKVVGWHEYVTCQNEEIALLDESIFNVAHFIAALAATDGAVVLTKQQELLGFGGFVLVDKEEVGIVRHAIDLEGTRTNQVRTDTVGSRHRAAYRFCQQVRDAHVIVISQDGDVEFVKWFNGAVTCWKYAPSGVPGF
jgi:hypothetical protein